MEVKELMKDVYVVNEDMPLHKAAQIMSSKKIGEILFIKNEKIKGIITEDDLVRNFDKDKKIKDIMTTNVIVIKENDPIDDALEIMNKNSIKRLPVLDSGSKIIGIIRLIDIARHAHELEEDFFFE